MELWSGIEPGDVGFDEGGGFVGFLIRHFSHSPYAHCWVYHGRDEGGWDTAEAYPGGLRMRRRANGRVHRVIRLWRNEDERQKLLAMSESLVGSGYNYRELFRIIHYRLRKLFWWLVGAQAALIVLHFFEIWSNLWLQVPLAALLVYAVLPLKTKLNSKRVICSNHVAQSVLAARPDVQLTFPPQSIWPGRLERDLNVTVWNDSTRAEGGGIEPPSL